MWYIERADSAYDQGRYLDYARLIVKAIDSEAGQQSELYVAAASGYAMADEKDSAFLFLDRAIDKGWKKLEVFEKDSSFLTLRQEKRWPSYLSRWRDSVAAFGKDFSKPLHDMLIQMATEDQNARKPFVKGSDSATSQSKPDSGATKRLLDLDRRHAAKVWEIVRSIGWPGKRLVGEDGSHAAWLLVQHADFDAKLQDTGLGLLRHAVARGDATSSDLAYLTDRVIVNKGEKQIYGTQTLWSEAESRFVPRPIADSAAVDERRRAVGMGPLGEYLKFLNQMIRPAAGVQQ